MHPIERLRYVARSSGDDHALMVRETAGALGALGFDPAGLVTACRRIVDRHPTSGPLWWLCARVLTAAEPMEEAWRCVDLVEDDPTAAELALALPDEATVCVVGWPEVVARALRRRGDLAVLAVDAEDAGHGFARRLRRDDVAAEEVPAAGLGAAAAAADLVLVEASAVGPDALVAEPGAHAAAAVAYCAERPVWVVGGVGRLLPGAMWQALLGRLDGAPPWRGAEDVVPLALATRLCGPRGPETVPEGLARTDCPTAPELFRTTAF